MTLALVPVASVLTLPAQVPLPAVTWDWAAGRVVAVCAHPESLTRRTERVREPGMQHAPVATSIHRARVVDILDRQATTVTEALDLLTAFAAAAYRACPSQVQLVSAYLPVRHAAFRLALASRIRTALGADDRLRTHCTFEVQHITIADTLPVYNEDTHALIEHAEAVGMLVQGRDDPTVPAPWYFDRNCPALPAARADIDAIVDLPEHLDDLGPLARCIARLSAFLLQPEHRAWTEPRICRDDKRGRDAANHARWDAMLQRVEEASR